MSVAVIDIEIETIATAGFGMPVLAEREEFGIGFGADAESSEIALIGCTTGRCEREPVPVRFIGQVQSATDEAPLRLEARIAGCGPGPGRPVLPLGAPVEPQFRGWLSLDWQAPHR